MNTNRVLLLCIILNVLPRVLSGELAIVYGCKNSHATVKFKKYTDLSNTLKFWKLKDDDNIGLELVASVLEGKVEVFGRYKGLVSVDEEGNLRIVNVSKEYEGVYRREIRNGGTFRELASLKVLDPPSGPPTIQQRLDENRRNIASCVNPNKLGMPKASVLKESFGSTQRNNMYRCCLKGESVDRCYPEDLPRCSSYITLNKTTEDTGSLDTVTSKDNNDIHLTKECDKKGLCIGIAVVAFTVCLVILFCCILCSAQNNVNKSMRTPNGGCIANKYKAGFIDITKYWFRLLASLTISTIFLILSAGYICSKEGCDNGYLMPLVGVSCFIIGILPSFQSIFKQNNNEIKKKASKENIRMNKTDASSGIPHLDLKRPLLHDSEDTDSENEQAQNYIVEYESSNTNDSEDTDSENEQAPNDIVENESSNTIITYGLDDSISRKQTGKYYRTKFLGNEIPIWNQNQNQKLENSNIMTLDYMSSEESEYEDEREDRRPMATHLKLKDEIDKFLKEDTVIDF